MLSNFKIKNSGMFYTQMECNKRVAYYRNVPGLVQPFSIAIFHWSIFNRDFSHWLMI
jgi:hypothetical protein